MPPDELDELDEELQGALGDTPAETLIEFGQAVGGSTYQEAISKLLNPNVTVPRDLPTPAPFSGPLVTGDELEQLRQIQHGQRSGSEPQFKPPRPLTDALAEDFWWFHLDEYETHPLYHSFRGITGRRCRGGERLTDPSAVLRHHGLHPPRTDGPTPPPHVVGLATFISAIGQACEMAPDWAEVLVFSTPPGDREEQVRQGWPRSLDVDHDRFTDRSLQVVSFTIVTTKREPEGRPKIPDWLDAFRTPERCPTKKL